MPSCYRHGRYWWVKLGAPIPDPLTMKYNKEEAHWYNMSRTLNYDIITILKQPKSNSFLRSIEQNNLAVIN